MDVQGLRGVEGFSLQDIKDEIAVGGRFIQYLYCISYIIVITRKLSDVYFVYGDESTVRTGMPYTLLSLIAGWWGLWGVIWTINSLVTNLSGGIDVTDTVVAALEDDAYSQSLGQWIKREYGS